jgi:ubiquitin carboxyl-terminal hydrolase 22/27/51
MGSTCFMNSILQALLHNPLLRSYFLADKHNERLCAARKKDGAQGVCLACEMDHVFGEVYSKSAQPFAPFR